jgi:ketosteroid isomerase-like protein
MTHHDHPNVTLVREGFAAFERGDMARMDQLLADDVVWHVGGNSKWAGTYQGKQQVLECFGRQAEATSGPTSGEIHDILGNDEHVVVLGSAKATARTGPAPSGSTPRSSTSVSVMGRPRRSGGWPRTTLRLTRSWTVSPTERRPDSGCGELRARSRRSLPEAAPAGWPPTGAAICPAGGRPVGRRRPVGVQCWA